jgi:hypothetical protein
MIAKGHDIPNVNMRCESMPATMRATTSNVAAASS